MGRHTGLGRGLGAIIPPKAMPQAKEPSAAPSTDPIIASEPAGIEGLRQIGVELIDPNPHQPREHFDHTGIEDLVSSIREHGVMQPIVVTEKSDGRYELIAGERRLRASKIAGKTHIPALIRSANEQQKLELSIIENVQRQDLNPLEEAKAYLRLQEEFNLSQDEISHRVGKSRPQVANIIRLLNLPPEIQTALRQGKISSSNARTLLSLPTEEERQALFASMLEGSFTVRQTEARVPHRRPRRPSVYDANVAQAENDLRDALGAKVVIKRSPHGEGEIRITFLNDEDFQSIKNKIDRE